MTELDEPTIRACIEALDDNEQHYARDTLLALLPKPVDPAEQLVEKFSADACDNGGSELQIHTYQLTHFARWLLDNIHLIQPEIMLVLQSSNGPDDIMTCNSMQADWYGGRLTVQAIVEQPLIQPRKEWSDGEIVKELERIPDKPYREMRIAAMLRGIEMGRQLAPVDPELTCEQKEAMADGYKSWSGKAHHMSDCATSRAPAYIPDKCDCDAPEANQKLTHDEIVKEAREWCGRTDPSYPWHTGEYDELPQMRHTIDLVTAWKGEK